MIGQVFFFFHPCHVSQPVSLSGGIIYQYTLHWSTIDLDISRQADTLSVNILSLLLHIRLKWYMCTSSIVPKIRINLKASMTQIKCFPKVLPFSFLSHLLDSSADKHSYSGIHQLLVPSLQLWDHFPQN